MTDDESPEALRQKLNDLHIEHRDLDEVLNRMAEDLHVDQLQIKRIKKRKLLLKDTIAKIESKLLPDITA